MCPQILVVMIERYPRTIPDSMTKMRLYSEAAMNF